MVQTNDTIATIKSWQARRKALLIVITDHWFWIHCFL